MSEFEGYISKVFQGTYLSKREQQIWREEMLSHLEESVEASMKCGSSRDEAVELALSSFGSARHIRRRIVRETFGISPLWYLSGTVLAFVAFVLSLFVNMRVLDYIPGTLTQLPTPDWVLFLHDHFPNSPSMWIGISVLCFMLIQTRKFTDRIAIVVSMLPFFTVWIINHVATRLFYNPREIFFSTSLPMVRAFSSASVAGYILLFVFCTALYMWTKNRVVSLTPWVISIALTLWPPLRDTVQTALWKGTNNPIFWGHYYPQHLLGYIVLTIFVRLIVLRLYLYGCKKINVLLARRSPIA